MLDDAMWHMQCQYNYQIVGKPTAEQIMARTKIGEMAASILKPISDDLILAGMRTYLEYLGYTTDQALKILKPLYKIEGNILEGSGEGISFGK